MLYFVEKPNGWYRARIEDMILSIKDNEYRLKYTNFKFKNGISQGAEFIRMHGEFEEMTDLIPLFQTHNFRMGGGRKGDAKTFITALKTGAYHMGGIPRGGLVLQQFKPYKWRGKLGETKIVLDLQHHIVYFKYGERTVSAKSMDGKDVDRQLLHAARGLVHLSRDMVSIINAAKFGHIEWKVADV